ncbi:MULTISPECIES: 3-deoxy-manno-octulosonate cytidylyltransferase [Thiorhodovibrio]|uniref:3-deoxy-manno-octulosonate cytidylyltransferase n=1 Tax=Thiorhodovibrio TaxID=61593 RepID=UPI0019143398|nr:3-deoxy-manno-octulosonate cytidylyltransferase [Thiorhodovibrio litoralis]MBK5969870.1 3-deoxy-manno-octulosonate cytidylyltransferase [Thiorhodovibrio winogradskyi]WPL12086.1 3-deoxy-manno-octulosonate cytidylyltransferase [Thiorhodovibrio litoralis]
MNPKTSSASPNSPFKVVIPARYGASRLPGKPLVDIGGKPLIAHVWERARASLASEVLIATDDDRIAGVCRELGAETVMTSAQHPSGSDRIGEVMRLRAWESDTIVVNLQGDEPCVPPALINQVAGALDSHPALGMATLSTPIDAARALSDPHVVKVVTDANGQALYFSRAPIPWHRDAFLGERAHLPPGIHFQRHIGLYAYRVGFLERFLAWPPAPLEQIESLEQLRVLWNGERIQVEEACAPLGPGVDTRDDIPAVLEWLGLVSQG